MATSAIPDSALAHRANLNIAAAVMAKYGSGASDSLIGRAIDEVRASHSVAELAGSGAMPMVLGAVETFLARNLETDRPRNLFSAEAARAAQAGEGGPRGFSTLDLSRPGSSARFCELGSGDGTKSDSSGSGRAAISGTGSEPAGAAFWGTEQGRSLTRAYASVNGMDWAPPDLMKMGRPALEALKESGLKDDGYKALRDPAGLHLDNTTIVAGAKGYMKRHGVDHNEAARSSAAVDRLAMPADMRERHRAAVKGIHTATPENDAQRREALKKSGDEIIQHDPTHRAAVERERRGYKVDQGNAPKVEAKVEQKSAAAQATGQKAHNDQKAAASSKNKLGAALGL